MHTSLKGSLGIGRLVDRMPICPLVTPTYLIVYLLLGLRCFGRTSQEWRILRMSGTLGSQFPLSE